MLWAGLAEVALVAVLQPWAGAVAARVRALAATGDVARLGRTTGTVLAAGAGGTALATLLVVGLADRLGAQLCQYAQHPEQMATAVPLLGLELALLPLAVTMVALAHGFVGPRLTDRLRGWLGLGAVAALGLATLGIGVQMWASVCLGGSLAAVLWLGVVLVRKGAGRGLGLAWAELRAVVPAVAHVPSEANLWNLPVMAAVLLLAVQLGVASHFADLALTSMALALGTWGSDVRERMAPAIDAAGAIDDPYRLRWRFGRHLDAANLVAVGMVVILLCYLGLASRLWLARLGPVAAPTQWLALWAAGVAPSTVLGAQLVRQDRGRMRLLVHVGELVAVVVTNGLAGGNALGAALASALAVRVVLLLVLAFPAICRHFRISYVRMTVGMVWRFALTALPAAATGTTFAFVKPPTTAREWALQLCIVGILYAVPAFTAWNLLDTRRNERA